jgi:hypothetical protein
MGKHDRHGDFTKKMRSYGDFVTYIYIYIILYIILVAISSPESRGRAPQKPGFSGEPSRIPTLLQNQRPWAGKHPKTREGPLLGVARKKTHEAFKPCIS